MALLKIFLLDSIGGSELMELTLQGIVMNNLRLRALDGFSVSMVGKGFSSHRLVL